MNSHLDFLINQSIVLLQLVRPCDNGIVLVHTLRQLVYLVLDKLLTIILRLLHSLTAVRCYDKLTHYR